MKKGFLALLLILLVGLISYQVYQNRLQLSGGNDQAKALNLNNDVSKPARKNPEPRFESASSTIEIVKNNANNTTNGIFAYFTVRVTAGAQPVKLPIAGRIDVLNVTATSAQPMTIASLKVMSESATSTIPAGMTMPVYFRAMMPATSTMPYGPYKAILKQLHLGDKVYRINAGTNVAVYVP